MHTTRTPTALSVAGSDPSGGAGIQADLKTFSALGVYGAAAITALTAQNTKGVTGVLPVAGEFVTAQLQALFDDLDVRVVKTGMLGSPDVVKAVAEALHDAPSAQVVVDPVMIAASGDRLVTDETIAATRDLLLPLATVVTPNLPEAAALLTWDEVAPLHMTEAGDALRELGVDAAVVKGGHAFDDPDRSDDVLVGDGYVDVLGAERVATDNTHGTGCTFASAIAAFLTRDLSLRDAAARAKQYLTQALHAADDLSVGHGHGPVHHFYATWGDA